MPKRKVDQSIDEWLSEGAAIAEANRRLAETHIIQNPNHTIPPVEGTREAEATDCQIEGRYPAAPPAHVAVTYPVATSVQVAVAATEVGSANVDP